MSAPARVHTLFEAHLPVADLDSSVAFYRDQIGLDLAHVLPGQAAFLWIGGRGRAMLGLWSAGRGPQKVTLHVAFGPLYGALREFCPRCKRRIAVGAHSAPARSGAGRRGPRERRAGVRGRAPSSSTTPEVLAAPRRLRAAGITPLDFDGRPTDEAVVLGWMPAVSVYFRDPDGHLLEYIAMLPDEPRPDVGVMTWNAWRANAVSRESTGSPRPGAAAL